MSCVKVQIKAMEIKKELYFKNVLMVKYTINYPKLAANCFLFGLDRINKYYEKKAKEYEIYCERDLYVEAVEMYRDTAKNNFPFHNYEFITEFIITCSEKCLLSLYTDRYEFSGGAHRLTKRSSNTWNMSTGAMYKLADVFPRQRVYIPYIAKEVETQISQNKGVYFEDYPALVIKTFDPNNFFLTNEALGVYYQQYDIAPYSTGIPVFYIAYAAGKATMPRCVLF